MRALPLVVLGVVLVGCGSGAGTSDPGMGKAGPTVGSAASTTTPEATGAPAVVGPAADAKAGGYRSK